MSDVKNHYELLAQRKGQRPFVPFDIVTDTGDRIPINRRFAFGFNERYVLIMDHKDAPVRIFYDHVAAYESQPQREVGKP